MNIVFPKQNLKCGQIVVFFTRKKKKNVLFNNTKYTIDVMSSICVHISLHHPYSTANKGARVGAVSHLIC